jgi:hypothetical protein
MRELIKQSVKLMNRLKEEKGFLEEEINEKNDRISDINQHIHQINFSLIEKIGLKNGEQVKFVQHEHFNNKGFIDSYRPYFEQVVEVKSLKLDGDDVIFGFSPCGKNRIKYYSNLNSYSVYRLDGGVIYENKLEHLREPEEVSEFDKNKFIRNQKI